MTRSSGRSATGKASSSSPPALHSISKHMSL
uniref:Uncharacterized protein n=1 Tax=Human herpesvirus 2 TaxID=10310 RepID=A0A481TWZ4_HHV2|nr:hypothetical protein [Human alphaherpesvirus 2]QBH85163.1 hypothetical protein [Human alphaherpesvirus 2]